MEVTMENDGELDLSEHALLQNSESSSNGQQASVSVDFFLDELLRTAQTCTHTHTCNPPGPDFAHTHTCFHTHTHVIPPATDDNPLQERRNPALKPRRSSGNREAVRKYREKKKAQTAYLEEEVRKLRFLNQQLVKKLQRQAILETEILRLRSVLVDLRGKIDNELGVLPFQKLCNPATTFKEGDCSGGLHRETDCPSCFHPQASGSAQACGVTGTGCGQMVASWGGHCQSPRIDCHANGNDTESAERH